MTNFERKQWAVSHISLAPLFFSPLICILSSSPLCSKRFCDLLWALEKWALSIGTWRSRGIVETWGLRIDLSSELFDDESLENNCFEVIGSSSPFLLVKLNVSRLNHGRQDRVISLRSWSSRLFTVLIISSQLSLSLSLCLFLGRWWNLGFLLTGSVWRT